MNIYKAAKTFSDLVKFADEDEPSFFQRHVIKPLHRSLQRFSSPISKALIDTIKHKSNPEIIAEDIIIRFCNHIDKSNDPESFFEINWRDYREDIYNWLDVEHSQTFRKKVQKIVSSMIDPVIYRNIKQRSDQIKFQKDKYQKQQDAEYKRTDEANAIQQARNDKAKKIKEKNDEDNFNFDINYKASESFKQLPEHLQTSEVKNQNFVFSHNPTMGWLAEKYYYKRGDPTIFFIANKLTDYKWKPYHLYKQEYKHQ